MSKVQQADFTSKSLDAAPEYDTIKWPAYIQITSTNNTPIESFWRWERQGEGHNMKYILLLGAKEGIFCPADELHM